MLEETQKQLDAFDSEAIAQAAYDKVIGVKPNVEVKDNLLGSYDKAIADFKDDVDGIRANLAPYVTEKFMKEIEAKDPEAAAVYRAARASK